MNIFLLLWLVIFLVAGVEAQEKSTLGSIPLRVIQAKDDVRVHLDQGKKWQAD